MLSKLKIFWRMVRRLSGDDAYERYLQHHSEHHQAEHAIKQRGIFQAVAG